MRVTTVQNKRVNNIRKSDAQEKLHSHSLASAPLIFSTINIDLMRRSACAALAAMILALCPLDS